MTPPDNMLKRHCYNRYDNARVDTEKNGEWRDKQT